MSSLFSAGIKGTWLAQPANAEEEGATEGQSRQLYYFTVSFDEVCVSVEFNKRKIVQVIDLKFPTFLYTYFIISYDFSHTKYLTGTDLYQPNMKAVFFIFRV